MTFKINIRLNGKDSKSGDIDIDLSDEQSEVSEWDINMIKIILKSAKYLTKLAYECPGCNKRDKSLNLKHDIDLLCELCEILFCNNCMDCCWKCKKQICFRCSSELCSRLPDEVRSKLR